MRMYTKLEEEEACMSQYPPSCPVYICDREENPPGIDAQGVITEVLIKPSTAKRGCYETVYKVHVKSKDKNNGEYCFREEIVEADNLIYKNSCKVFYEVPHATTCDNEAIKSKAVVLGFYILESTNKRRRRESGLRYILQEVGGRKMIHNRVHPDEVSFRHDEEELNHHEECDRNGGTIPNTVSKCSDDQFETSSQQQAIPNCINLPDPKDEKDEKDEISSATLASNMPSSPQQHLSNATRFESASHDASRQKSHHHDKQPSTCSDAKGSLGKITLLSANTHIEWDEDHGTIVKNDKQEMMNSSSSFKNTTTSKNSHHANRKQSSEQMKMQSLHTDKLSNPICSPANNLELRQDIVEKKQNIARATSYNHAPSRILSISESTNRVKPEFSSLDKFKIDSPLKSARSKEQKNQYVKTEQKQYMYELDLNPLSVVDLKVLNFQTIKEETGCDSICVDNRSRVVEIYSTSPSIVQRTANVILHGLKSNVSYGRNKLQHIMINREKIVETYGEANKDGTSDLHKQRNQRQNDAKSTCSGSSAVERNRSRGGSQRGEHKLKLIIPMRRNTAYDILIGEGGITHKAIMKITKCRILLSSCDHDKCSVTVTGESESRVDHAYTVICDTFAKARVSRRTLDEIRIVDLLGRESGRKRPRRR